MSDHQKIISSLRAARAARDEARQELQRLRLEQLRLRRLQKKVDRREVSDSGEAPPELARLRARIDELLAKLREVERELATLVGRLTGAQTRRKRELEEERARLQREIEALKDEAARAPGRGDHAGAIEDLGRRIPEQRAVLNEREKTIGDLIGLLFGDRTPQQLIEVWDDTLPIMLLPLRLETRFKNIDGRAELWVRVLPDEIVVTTHEKVLTEAERKCGMDYWQALQTAAGDAERQQAWKELADRFGANRSAWVALQTKPSNWSTPPPAVTVALDFPTIDVVKPDSWTEAPHSRVLPDRFVLMAYRGTTAAHTLVGRQIPDPLILGPGPIADDGRPTLRRDPTGNHVDLGEDLRWLADFPLAVERGLGFRVPLNAEEAASGFSQLLVIGLKLSADENDAQKLVEELIDGHHFSASGFGLLRQGTATNNTDADPAGFTSSDWLHDVSYFVETGAPLFQVATDPAAAGDAQRLAEYLGIGYEPLQHVHHADAADHAEAVAMNRALYAGTLGYYLHSMLNEVMSAEAIDRLREFFTDDVTGRGPLPAIRVGNQPYGILLTSAFPRWTYGRRELAADPFDEQVRRVLASLVESWKSLEPQLGHISKKGNARAGLMDVLGLQPTSADYYQRVGYSLDYLRNREEFAIGGKYFEDIYRRGINQFYEKLLLESFGYQRQRADGTPKPTPLLLQIIFQHYQTRLDNRNLIDSLPLSETRPIQPYNEGAGLNYIHWLRANAGNADKLETQDFGAGAKTPTALLYLMLHNAVLLEAKQSLFRLFERFEIRADELVRSRKFMNLSGQPDISAWEVFRAPANRVLPTELSDRPLLDFIQLDRFTQGSDRHIGRHFAEAKEALGVLAGLPTARLERTFAEHLDTLSYRLDSWQTALFERRARARRGLVAGGGTRRLGLYLGSYGYLENVAPSTARRTPVPEDVLPEPLRTGTANLFSQEGNGGYVHAPSLNHATAASILRNGYLTHATPAEREQLSVNLSSERVRRARYLLDGVRHGQTLEQLLGYLFERGLHDFTTRSVQPILLEQLKPLYRQAFPIKKTKVPRQGFASEVAEVIDDFSVVNGLALARLTSASPFGINVMPALDTAQIAALKQIKEGLANSLDALRDVLTAESAYQLALGNFDRAGAVMQAISGGQIPTEIEVINSARGTEMRFTNRVALHFDPAITANPWPAISLTLRARTEPAFNHWLGRMLGDPATVSCHVRGLDAAGATLAEGPVFLADLALQPLDLLYLLGKKVESTGYAELESRVRYRFARAHALADSTLVKIEFGTGGGAPAGRSFAEILPLLNAVREMAGKARPLHAGDFVPASKTVTALADNPGNLDLPELQARVAAVRTDFDGLIGAVQTAAGNVETLASTASVDALRDSLAAIGDAGLVHAYPLSAQGFDEAQTSSLLSQALSVASRCAELVKAYDASLARVNTPGAKPPQQATLLRDMARSFLGDEFVILPKFTPLNTPELQQAHLHRDQLLVHIRSQGVPLPVDEWLHGVALVRPSMHTFGLALMLAGSADPDLLPCSPLQLPFRDQDSWLGVEFPEETAVVHDTLSFVQCLPQGFAPAGVQCGLLIDEWTESVPRRQEVTGLAFNFNQPNSAPPAAILLAVTPEETGHWKWENLAASVLDTFQRARLRAVEPDKVDHLPGLATLLPSIMAEFSTAQSTVSLDYARNVWLMREKIKAAATIHL